MQNPLQKAAIDSEKFQTIMNAFTKEDMEDLKSLEDFLHPFDVATRQLSVSGTNLHQADLIVQILLDAIKSPEIREYAIEKLSRRRSLLSDVLLYLSHDAVGIELYRAPSKESIKSLFNQVIIIVVKNLFHTIL